MISYKKISLIMLFFGFALGCSGGSVPMSAPGDAGDVTEVSDVGTDTEVRDLIEQETYTRSDVITDADTENEGITDDFGKPCLSNKDCLSGYCIETPDGFECTKPCVTDCPRDWICRATFVGEDLISLCMPASATLCKPCKTDTQCALGACVSMGDSSVCGLNCNDDQDCPKSYKCIQAKRLSDGMEIKQCLPNSGTCDCTSANAGEQKVCSKSNGDWTCYGTQTCDPEKGWVNCDAKTPQPEECNGQDDNCNGVTDENAKPPSDTCQIKNQFGVCQGTWTCKGKDGWVCSGQTPAKELCNGMDDDCDGETDEDWPDKNKVCTVGEGACERTGVYECADDGAGVVCNVKPGQPIKEMCNGIDDDCDGETDEDWPELGQACVSGLGECAAKGFYTCSQSGKGKVCKAQPSDPQMETCDNKDDDCNGVTDDPGAIGCVFYYKDNDKDGYGEVGSGKCLCAPDGQHSVTIGGDCNDSDPKVHPFGTNACASNDDCCMPTNTCVRRSCVYVQGSCTTDKDCTGDYYCDAQLHQCLPWTVNPAGDHDEKCVRKIKIGIFRPQLQCAWIKAPAHDPYPQWTNVIPTATVADFDFDHNPDTVKPSIVFVTVKTAADRPADFGTGIVRIIDGATCKQQYEITAHKTVGADPVAIGDLDGDKHPEIVANADGGGVVAFKFNAQKNKWEVLWHSHNANGSANNFGRTTGRWDGPSIADVDGDGIPEVISGAMLMDHTGKVIASNLGLKKYSAGQIPVVADVDGDGQSELVTGDGVWRYDKSRKRWQKESYFRGSVSDGFVALGDFGKYSEKDLHKSITLPEVVVVSDGRVRIQTLSGRIIFGPFSIPNGGTGGAPTVADFDGDGKPEFATAGRGSYTVFDPQCNKNPVPFGCYGRGILWSVPSQDYSSSITGSSVFDFDKDGRAEAIYADECFVRVYEGNTGKVLFSWGRSSGTWYENPIVADVDGDKRAELVIGSNGDVPQCPSIDPYFRGLMCEDDKDCPSGKEGSCVAGYCRCKTDTDCGKDGDFKCTAPISNTPGQGKVCRTPHPSGGLKGLFVFRDRNDNWAASRAIWNQHAYYVTNVNDDGTIPKAKDTAKNWSTAGLNNFRQNVQGDVQPAPAADLTVRFGRIGNCDANGDLDVQGYLCNRGADNAPKGIKLAFTVGPPAEGNVQCMKQTQAPLAPGKCLDFTCTYHVSSSIQIGLWANYGQGEGAVNECKDWNNFVSRTRITCSNLE